MKKLLILSLLFFFNGYAVDNKCNKCYKSCIDKPNYNKLSAEDIIRDASLYSNQDLSFILSFNCCEECEKKACQL